MIVLRLSSSLRAQAEVTHNDPGLNTASCWLIPPGLISETKGTLRKDWTWRVGTGTFDGVWLNLSPTGRTTKESDSSGRKVSITSPGQQCWSAKALSFPFLFPTVFCRMGWWQWTRAKWHRSACQAPAVVIAGFSPELVLSCGLGCFFLAV